MIQLDTEWVLLATISMDCLPASTELSQQGRSPRSRRAKRVGDVAGERGAVAGRRSRTSLRLSASRSGRAGSRRATALWDPGDRMGRIPNSAVPGLTRHPSRQGGCEAVLAELARRLGNQRVRPTSFSTPVTKWSCCSIRRCEARSTGIEVGAGKYAQIATFRAGLMTHWKFYPRASRRPSKPPG